jgi:RNA polymerase sigma-70 factor, ECF subfamily
MVRETFNNDRERELVEASVKGDKKAFGEIVDNYSRMVAKTVKGMLGDNVFAEDIGQEVFIKLYYSLPDFRGDSKLSTYIQKIAVNLTLNEIKKRKRAFSLFSMKGDDDLRMVNVPDGDAGERREAAEIVDKALMELEPAFRIVVTMRMLQGYSTRETSEILGIPEGTVLSRLSRAQEQLRNILIKYV